MKGKKEEKKKEKQSGGRVAARQGRRVESGVASQGTASLSWQAPSMGKTQKRIDDPCSHRRAVSGDVGGLPVPHRPKAAMTCFLTHTNT